MDNFHVTKTQLRVTGMEDKENSLRKWGLS